MSFGDGLRDRLRRRPFHLEDRARVPWTDVDVDRHGNPLHEVPRDEDKAESVPYWIGPDGERIWVFGD